MPLSFLVIVYTAGCIVFGLWSFVNWVDEDGLGRTARQRALLVLSTPLWPVLASVILIIVLFVLVWNAIRGDTEKD